MEFDDAAFAKRTLTVMSRVNEAWIAGDMGPARALISDGVYVRFQTYLSLLAAKGKRNLMGDWKALSATRVRASSDERWDTIHMLVVGIARDVDVPTADSAEKQQRAVKRARRNTYEEVWSFVRRRGVLTIADVAGGALEGSCPKCGAPLPRSQVVRCDSCRAVVNSGEFDWVLAEIASRW